MDMGVTPAGRSKMTMKRPLHLGAVSQCVGAEYGVSVVF